ncbi:MAG: quinone-dependent dihydroorotate dehydrogenase [Gammaproteobacteria bacterium]|nr:quinone-dependent dihydroorotate dehydrogenase [Gammaproteobacteria bacterium]
MNLYQFFRPLIFSFSPEFAHLLTLRLVRLYGYLPSNREISRAITHLDMNFENRVGLAAGFDKDGVALPGLLKLKFGFLELGAVTPRSQTGNPPPRLFRLIFDNALINSLGFNNRGVDALVQRVVTSRVPIDKPLGVNIGKNFDTSLSDAADDYLYCFQQLQDYVDFITVNISSPNTPGLRDLQMVEHAKPVLGRLVQARETAVNSFRHRVSILVKISPDLDEDSLRHLCAVIKDSGCDGIIATNTTIKRTGLVSTNASKRGGLSGKPLFQDSLRTVRLVRENVGENFIVVGCGGIWDGESACAMLAAGANLIQLYTALVYRGPGCIKEIVEATDEFQSQTD